MSIRCCVSVLAAVLLSCLPNSFAWADRILADFEDDSYAPWTIEGEAFGKTPAAGTLAGQNPVDGFLGQQLVNTFYLGDETVGTLTSPPFQIDRDHLAFLIAGGNHPDRVGIQLIHEQKVVRTATGDNSEQLRWHNWDVTDLRGESARLRIFDHHQGGWGHICVDHVLLTDAPRENKRPLDLAAYRQSADYYREPYRPQFHFTPEINWMNDPNGLVFYDGEYHLFYQFNPFGNVWGHMSWGHAVSGDLVHWRHLPVALWEENDIAIFSGCAVVDENNSSNFGTADNPPIVAIYTGHGKGKQTQNLAYSTDRGRTWTKYQDNPVIDIDHTDFRDPKVFWHKPTERWIMVVALAADKKLQFYNSSDLKHWQYLSDFGPAGVDDKPNWECPDLFLLPVENEPGTQHWVLEADMGGGSIAGGSGGEYFVGDFDGKRFQPLHPLDEVRWVDYGRDFYAAVSYSGIPADDGRRIWIGWMNNWQTHMVPTAPWRGAQSIPRSLSLRKIDDDYLLIQRPITELKKLRSQHYRVENLEIETRHELPESTWGATLEIVATIRPGSTKQVGLVVRKGGEQQTRISYDTAEETIAIDRTESGATQFHPQFAGIHRGSLQLRNGLLKLHIFVDRSSVEVFGNDGTTVITDRIFPDTSSEQLMLFSQGGKATFVSLDVWQLDSIWRPVDDRTRNTRKPAAAIE